MYSNNAAKKVQVLVYNPAFIGYGSVPSEPIAVYDPNSAEQVELLSDRVEYKLPDDFDDAPNRIVRVYAVEDYCIPDWLSPEEFVANFESWGKLCVGRAVIDKDGVEYSGYSVWVDWFGQDVRKLAGVSDEVRDVIYDLFSKNIRSEFKKSCKQQIVDWVSGLVSYASPLSDRQIECLLYKERRYY